MLYAFTKDPRGRSVCSGACAAAWPPYLVVKAPKAGLGVKRSLLGSIRRANGKIQVTYAGRPLYYYVGALSCRVFGTGLFALRLVSFVSSLGCFGVLYAIVQRDTGSRLLGIFGLSLFAATFELSGAWFDIARVDSLALLLAFAGCFASLHWSFGIADRGHGHLWPQILATSVGYGVFLAVLAAAFFLRRKWFAAR